MANNTKNSTAQKGPSKAELEAQIAELKAQLLAAKQGMNMAGSNVSGTPYNDVAVVYCSESLGHANISNMELNFTRYGEEFIMSRTQFDELVGKYRNWFDRGVLAVSHKNIDVAAAKGLKTDYEVGLDAAKLEAVGRMSLTQIETLWNDLKMPAQKESVVYFFKRKFMEGDPDYRDRAKIDLLNRLTDGGFVREQDELSGRFKIDKTDM